MRIALLLQRKTDPEKMDSASTAESLRYSFYRVVRVVVIKVVAVVTAAFVTVERVTVERVTVVLTLVVVVSNSNNSYNRVTVVQ